MAKSKSVYVCSECGAQSPQWLGRCPGCGKFGTLVEEIAEAPAPAAKKEKRERSAAAHRPVPLSEVREEHFERISSGMEELDTVLGGGIVPGSLVLIGGDPGIGKSTLLTEVSAHLSNYFEGEKEDSYKILRAYKNRFGSVQEVGVFEMTGEGIFGVSDYSDIFLSENRGEAAGSCVTPSETGNRCMMVEIQTLMAKSAYGLPRRMPLGIDYNKLVLLIAVLEKRCGIPFFNQDVYLNAMGGIRLNEPAVDLAVCAALASAARGTPVDKYTAVFGEVGLTGEVRGVTFAEKRVNECIKMGFKRVLFPAKNFKSVKKFEDKIELVPVHYVSALIRKLFPEEK